MVSKVVLALGSLTHEMDHLCWEAEDQFYGPIFYYGEGMDTSGNTSDGQAAKAIAKLLDTLQAVKGYSDHCADVVVNTSEHFLLSIIAEQGPQ